MKAWEIRNSKLGLHDVELDRSCQNETIVYVSHIGICGSDLPKLLQPSGFTLPSRWRPGHEIVGTDPDGRAVVIEPLMPCNICLRCVVGDIHLCSELRRIGWDLPGGFAEQVVVPATNVHPLPDGLKPITAILADAAAVAIHGLRCNPIGSPGRLAIIGAGAVGLLTAFYAHQQGWEVTVVQSDDQAPSKALVDAVPAVFQPSVSLQTCEPFDVVVDAATGVGPTPLELALRLVRDGGAIVIQNAYHPRVQLPTPLRDVFRRSIRLFGSFSYCCRGSDDFTLALNLLHSNAKQIAQLTVKVGQLTDLLVVLRGQPPRSTRQVLIVNNPGHVA